MQVPLRILFVKYLYTQWVLNSQILRSRVTCSGGGYFQILAEIRVAFRSGPSKNIVSENLGVSLDRSGMGLGGLGCKWFGFGSVPGDTEDDY